MNVSTDGLRSLRRLYHVLMDIPDDPSISEGTPIGFQFVGRRFQEEKMIAIAELFGDALGRSRD